MGDNSGRLVGEKSHVAKKSSSNRLNVYANLSHRRRTKKDAAARRRAEYLATLPKHPLKRMLYRLHPKRVAAYWFSKRGLFMGLKIIGVFLLLVVLGVGALFAYYRKDLDQIRPDELAKRVQTTVTRYYDRNGQLLWEDKGDGNYKLVVKSEEISDYMKKATVAIEDKDFYTHGGVSVPGLMRAVINNASDGSTQGGSTLTQQLVKQVFFADQAYNRGLGGIPRKIKEIILSIEVERMYNKDQILTLYLNESPYGGRRNGIESAAETYFGTSAKNLTLAQSALLAAIPNQPGLYDPYNTEGNQALIERQHKVLDDMVQQKYVTQSQADDAKKVNILDTIRPQNADDSGKKAPHFVDMVRSQLETQLGKATVGKGGLNVTTTLDLNIQTMAEQQMTNMFNSSIPTKAGFSNGAITLEDVRTGQILALVGSRDYNYPGFGQDNAATAYLQPGSTVKPLVYAQLFQNQGQGKQNYGSGSVLSDVKTGFPDGNGGTFYPQNATGTFMGNIPIRTSLDLSRNIPAMKAMQIAGINTTLNTIKAMGDTNYCTQGNESQVGVSAAIGGCGTRMIDHVNALASLARGGAYVPQSSVLKVTNSSGDVLLQYKSSQKQVVDPQAAYIVNDILGDVNARRPLYGYSITKSSDAAGIRVAAKTGTSNAEINGVVTPKDIWTVSYTPSLALAVWFGNPEPKPTYGLSSYASSVSDPLMTEATQYYQGLGKAKKGEWFTAPAGIQTIGGQLYPSYYNKNTTTNATLSFDKVSKRKATDCTPAGAKVDVGVNKTTDPFSNQPVYIAPDGYDATQDDNVHKCSDTPPVVSVPVISPSGQISVSVAQGTFSLATLNITVNGQSAASIPLSGSGNYSASYSFSGAATVVATVEDAGLYNASQTAQYTP